MQSPDPAEMKALGNAAFGRGDYTEAVSHYSRAIGVEPRNGVFYCNRAQAHYRLGSHEEAVADCTRALEFQDRYAKAMYRRAESQIALERWPEALADLRKLLEWQPHNAEATARLNSLKRELFQKRFLETITIEEKNVIEAKHPVDLEPPSADYSGPAIDPQAADRLPDEKFVDAMIAWFRTGGTLDFRTLAIIFRNAYRVLASQPTLVDLHVPSDAALTVVGDLHGNFHDLLHILRINGRPSDRNWYLFNGDFVDRGKQSCEVILTLLAMRVAWPTQVHLGRGNHEFEEANRTFGFTNEVLRKYGPTTQDMFICLFGALPLAHVVKDTVLVLHGGLSSDPNLTLDDLRKFDRIGAGKTLPPNIMDLLWSDPQTKPGRSPSMRGSGIVFGPDVLQEFLDRNNLTLLIRSHQCQQNGFAFQADNKLITVHSASNYCDSENAGGIIRFDAGDREPRGIRYEPADALKELEVQAA